MRYFVITLLLLLVGCKPQFHLKRSKHHYEKAIEKGYSPTVDTVYKEMPVIQTETRIDSIIFPKQYDTIRIEKDRLKLVYVDLVDSVYIEGTCEADTTYIEVPIEVQEKVYIELNPLEWIFKKLGINKTVGLIVFWILIVLLLALFVYKNIPKIL